MMDTIHDPVGYHRPALELSIEPPQCVELKGIGLRAEGRCAPLSPLGIALLRLYLATLTDPTTRTR